MGSNGGLIMYIPEQRDIVYISFDPSLGHEIKKRRPALIVSNNGFNESTGFCIVCPITSTHRKFGTYVEISEPKIICGDIVTHQIRSVDYTKRSIEFIEKCDPVSWANTLATIEVFV